MSHSSSENIKREIDRPSKAELTKELYDPLSFMEANELTFARKKKRRRALAMIAVAIGLPLFAYIFDGIFFPNGSNITGPQASKNGIGTVILASILLYLGLRGLYGLMTIERAIAFERRSRLLLMYPELDTAEATRRVEQKDSPWPKRIIGTIIALPFIYVILFYLALWLKLITVE